MSEFSLYFQLGLNHILDIRGYDHILFVIALCAVYLLDNWKQVLILVTAFTIGHSITLALSALAVISVNAPLIEFLIPVTIFITAFANLFAKAQTDSSKKLNLNYLLALGFGLIHGMGFSNYLKSLLGKDTTIVKQLFAFNIGLEIGQIVIVLAFIAASFLFVNILKVHHRDWRLTISAAVGGVALTMIFENIYW